LTDFLSPPELAEMQRVFSRLTEVQLVAWGGYPQAERQRVAIARSELPLDQSQVNLVLLEIAGNFLFDTGYPPRLFRRNVGNRNCQRKNWRYYCFG
jgi:RNA-binding protein YlmH